MLVHCRRWRWGGGGGGEGGERGEGASRKKVGREDRGIDWGGGSRGEGGGE